MGRTSSSVTAPTGASAAAERDRAPPSIHSRMDAIWPGASGLPPFGIVPRCTISYSRLSCGFPGVTTGPSVRLPTVHTRLRGVPGQSEPSRSADRHRARPGLTLRDPSAAVRRVNHAGRTPGRELPVPPFPGVPGGWGSRGLAAVGGSCRPPFPGVPGFLGLLGAHGGLPPWVGAAGRRSRVSWVPGAPGGSRGLAPVWAHTGLRA